MHRSQESRRVLVTCYTVEVLALAIWVGGLLAIIIAVIPAVFNSLGMEPGGRFLTRVFEGYNRLVGFAVAILVAGMGVRTWVQRKGHPPEALRSRAVGPVEGGLFLAMVTVAILIGWVLGPESVRLQEAAFAAPDEAAKKTAYEAFFRSHMVVRGLYLLNLALGIALIAVKVRGWTSPMEPRGESMKEVGP